VVWIGIRSAIVDIGKIPLPGIDFFVNCRASWGDLPLIVEARVGLLEWLEWGMEWGSTLDT